MGCTFDEKTIRPNERHERWLREHIDMGWNYAKGITGDERENKRLHKDMISVDKPGSEYLTREMAFKHYHELGKATQDKEHLCGIYEFLEKKKLENLQELERK